MLVTLLCLYNWMESLDANPEEDVMRVAGDFWIIEQNWLDRSAFHQCVGL